MRILIVNSRHYYGGGDSNYAFNLAGLLRENGHDVFFFAMHSENNLPDPNSDLFVSHIDFRALNQRKSPRAALQVLERSIYSQEARARFAQLLDRVNPDIIHLHNIHAHITPSIVLVTRKRSLPVVWTLHDYKLVCPNSHFLVDQGMKICEACRGSRFWYAAVKKCKKGSLLASGMASLEAYVHQFLAIRENVDAFLCPSNFLRTKLLENGFNEKKTHHLPLFIPDEKFQFTPKDNGYILFLGKLEPLKGVYPLLEAARLAADVPVVLAGNAEEPILSQLDHLPPNVKYVGFQTGEALANLCGNARAIVLPSLWYENQPLSILEAFALGKPVIASQLGGMSELVGNNERGLLVEPGNSQQLAHALQKMVSTGEEITAMKQRAFSYAKQEHSSYEHYKKIIRVYSDISRTI